MLNLDDYVNNSKDSEAGAGLYDTYIFTEMNLPDSDRNAVYGCIKKRFWNDDVQAVCVVNRDSLLDKSK